ncbi:MULTISPECIES: gas vesicle protein [unclassified Nocardia]|uniref:gas vesicle protein n=1 Tax=unclassified Nocardia TaxID=2637762 RepID=UPI003446F446
MRPTDQSVDGERRVALVDLLDRVLAGGVIISGDIRLAIADVDLVAISLRALISSISSLSVSSVESATAHPELEPPRDD